MQYKFRKARCPIDNIKRNHHDLCFEYEIAADPPTYFSHIQTEEVVTSWPVTTLWIILSWLVSTMATTAYIHPEWLVKESQPEDSLLTYDRDMLVSTVGMVSVCHRGKEEDSDGKLRCRNFEEDFPSSAWQTSYVLFGSACVLLTWCSILAFCNVWIVGRKNRKVVAVLIGRIQLVAAFLQAASLFLYPLVLGTSLAKIYCGKEADVYNLSECRVGWAYTAAIISTVLTCYCPMLAYFSHYTTINQYKWTDI